MDIIAITQCIDCYDHADLTETSHDTVIPIVE